MLQRKKKNSRNQNKQIKIVSTHICVNLEASPMVLYRLPNDKKLKRATIKINNYTRETLLLSEFSQVVKISPGSNLGLGSGHVS